MLDQKFSVFVSSTLADLVDDRNCVIATLREAGYVVEAMEHFDASDEPQLDYIRDVLRKCDYYVVIVADRYGTEEPGSGKSYTQIEYEIAKSMRIPCLAFLKETQNEILVDRDASKTERLTAFKTELLTDRLARKYRTTDHIGNLVHLSLISAQNKQPRPGWIRGDQVISNEYLIHIKNLNDELSRLETYVRDLESLQDFSVEETFLKRLFTIRLGSGMTADGNFANIKDTLLYGYEILSAFDLLPNFLSLEIIHNWIQFYTCNHSGSGLGSELDIVSADAFIFEALEHSVFLALINEDGSYSLHPGRLYVRAVGLAKVLQARTYTAESGTDADVPTVS